MFERENTESITPRLRKEPMTVSTHEEIVSIFELDDNLKPLEYVKNDFEDNGDGTITDHATGLIWQKSGSPDYMDYGRAKAYIEGLNRKKFAGYGDWRLPTINESKSLLTPEKQSGNMCINPIFDKKQRWCWTSDKGAAGASWFVCFDDGNIFWDYDSVSDSVLEGYVRAVCSGY